MTKAQIPYDVTIIGAGRVGLPFALLLETKKLKIAIVDKNKKLINNLRKRKVPFQEKGIKKLLSTSKLKCYINNYPKSKYYIITVGTPLLSNIETDLSNIKNVVFNLIKKGCIKKSTIILRSTVAPFTTKFISELIRKETGMINGNDYYLAICPERIVEGDALNELQSLPQMIGADDNHSWFSAKKLFSNILPSKKILRGKWIEAELGKLFSNIYRYINFAIPNYFMMVADKFDIDPFRLFDLMNKDYPRNAGLKSPGLTAGTCLRKDFGMVNEYFPQTDLILQAYKINEFMAKFIADKSSKYIKKNTKVGLLGYTFKSDSDDVRDTLTVKVFRYLERLVPKKISVSDYNIPLGAFKDELNNINFRNLGTKELISSCDVVIICTNHKKYYNELSKYKLKQKIFIDPWRVLKKDLVVNF